MDGITVEASSAADSTTFRRKGTHPFLSTNKSHDPTQDRDSPTAELIRFLSLKVQQCFSERDFAAAYVNPHHHLTYTQERPGRTVTLNAQEAQAWMRDVIHKHMDKDTEIVSITIDIDEKHGIATVWIVLKIFEEPKLNESRAKQVPYACLAPGIEKVSIMQWHRNENFSWQWKSHVGLPPVPPLP